MKAPIQTLLAALLAAGAAAQSPPPTFLVTVPNPGARSVGFGGAFVALADDATAAFSNPAGLDQLTRPELSAELRFEFSREVPGRASAADFTGLGFVSFVYPARRWSVAAYSNVLANARPFLADAFAVESYGLSGAYRLSDTVSLGMGLSFFDGKLGGMSSTDWGVTVGILWRLSPRWKAGAVYRQGADLDLAPGAFLIFPLDLPDTAGAGVAYRTPKGNLTVAFEWDRVRYSRLLENLPGEDLVLEDGDELHLGAEYAFGRTGRVVALRAGFWRDPDHQLRRASERARGAETHQTLGLGFAFRRLQLDLGADFSSVESILSLSLVRGF